MTGSANWGAPREGRARRRAAARRLPWFIAAAAAACRVRHTLAAGLVAGVLGCLAAGAAEETIPVPASGSVTNPAAEPGPGVPAESTNASAPSEAAAPSSKPVPPAAALRPLPGLRAEVVADETLVSAPVAMAFDEQGRLFVAERPEDNPRLGRIRLLSDTDHDGVFDQSSVYAEDLPHASSVACYKGGVFVAATPEILYLKDLEGAGTATVRRVMFKGFGQNGTSGGETGSSRLIGHLTWGPDGRIYGTSAGLGGEVSSPAAPSLPAVELEGADFSFDPRTLALRREAGPAESGILFDPFGRRFASEYRRPLLQVMYDPAHFLRNPGFAPAPALREVVPPSVRLWVGDSGGTGLPAASETPGALTGAKGEGGEGPRRSRPFLAAQGGCIYADALLPTNFYGNLFIAEPAAGVVCRLVLRTNGLEWVAHRPAGQATREFLEASDPQFHPVQVAVGPEGALYVADRRDGASGRIYRVVPETYRPAPAKGLEKADARELVAALASTNQWRRETAQRLLVEREESNLTPTFLGQMLLKSPAPVARIQALHALANLGVLTEKLLVKALQAQDERVREQALRVADAYLGGRPFSETLAGQFKTLSRDSSLRVRYQLALALGQAPHPGRGLLLAEILAQDADNPWLRTAVLCSVPPDAGAWFTLLSRNPRFARSPAGEEFLRVLAGTIGLRSRPGEVAAVIQHATSSSVLPVESLGLLASLGEGLKRNGNELAAANTNGVLDRVFSSALLAAGAAGTEERLRLEALRLVGVSRFTYAEAGDVLLLLLTNPRVSPAVQAAAVSVLSQYADPRLATNVLNRWTAFAPALRPELVSCLLARVERAGITLEAIQNGVIPPADLSFQHVHLPRSWPDPTIRQWAERVFGPLSLRRPEAVEFFQPALRLEGNRSRGQRIFSARCASCHSASPADGQLGPSLRGVGAWTPGELLSAVLEPTYEIRPGYETWLFETREAAVFVGRVEAVTPETIVLRRPGQAATVWPRAAFFLTEPRPWSLMPEALENGLTPQDMADLLEYLRGL
jgi:putative membrane-bound dehydrogenase-like protein